MRRCAFLLAVLLWAAPPRPWPGAASPASAQPRAGGARALALGSAATALRTDRWASANDAAWAHAPGLAVGVAAAQGYGLSELRTGTALALAPLSWASVGASLSTYGFDSYRETRARLGLARAWGPPRRRLAVGVGLTLHHVRIEGYGSASAPVVSAGLMLPSTRSVTIGVHASNVFDAALTGGEPIARTLALGFAYDADDRARVLIDVVKDVDFTASVRGGVEIAPIRALALRAGATSAPARFSAGVGVRAGPLRADVAAVRHDVLGWSSAASALLAW